MGPVISSSSPGMIGHGGMMSMGSAPTPRNLMSANAFVSSQGLQNRNLSDLGSYLELLSLSTGQEQVLLSYLLSGPPLVCSFGPAATLVAWGLTCCRAAAADVFGVLGPCCSSYQSLQKLLIAFVAQLYLCSRAEPGFW